MRTPSENDRDWHEVQADIAALRKRVIELTLPSRYSKLHQLVKQSILVHLKIAELKVELMRAKELQK